MEFLSRHRRDWRFNSVLPPAGEAPHRLDDPMGGPGVLPRVDLLREVTAAVVLWVPEGGGVGEHQGGIPFFPEGPVIGPGDPGNPLEGGDRLHGKIADRHEVAEELYHQSAGRQITYHPQEVSG